MNSPQLDKTYNMLLGEVNAWSMNGVRYGSKFEKSKPAEWKKYQDITKMIGDWLGAKKKADRMPESKTAQDLATELNTAGNKIYVQVVSLNRKAWWAMSWLVVARLVIAIWDVLVAVAQDIAAILVKIGQQTISLLNNLPYILVAVGVAWLLLPRLLSGAAGSRVTTH